MHQDTSVQRTVTCIRQDRGDSFTTTGAGDNGGSGSGGLVTAVIRVCLITSCTWYYTWDTSVLERPIIDCLYFILAACSVKLHNS